MWLRQSEDFLHESNMQPRSQSKLSKLQFNPQIPQIPQNEPFRLAPPAVST